MWYSSLPLIRSFSSKVTLLSKVTPLIKGQPSYQRPTLSSKDTLLIKGKPSHQRPPLLSKANPLIKGHPSYQRPPLLSKVNPLIKGHPLYQRPTLSSKATSYQVKLQMHWAQESEIIFTGLWDSKILKDWSQFLFGSWKNNLNQVVHTV